MTYRELFLRLQHFSEDALGKEVFVLDAETDRTALIESVCFNPAGYEGWKAPQAFLRIGLHEQTRLRDAEFRTEPTGGAHG